MRYLSRIVQLLPILAVSLLLSACNHHDTYQGYIEGEYTYLASAVAGNLTQLLVNRGSQVKIGQPVFVLDPEPEFSKLQQAKASLAEAEQRLVDLQKGSRQTILESLESQRKQAMASLDLTQKTLARFQALLAVKAIDKESVDQIASANDQNLHHIKEIEANLAEAKLGARENLIQAQKNAVTASEAQVKQAEWALMQKSIKANVNGQIVDTLYQEGEFVVAGAPVAILLPPHKIYAVFYVPEKIISKIKVNDSIMFGCDGCKKFYQAKINFISPQAEFTPPIIYSKDSRDKLVFRVEAYPEINDAVMLHPGQPVDVMLNEKIK